MRIYHNKARNKWEVRIPYYGKMKYIGSFDSKRKAIAAGKQTQKEFEKLEKIKVTNFRVRFVKPRKNKDWTKHSQGGWFKREWTRLKIMWSER